MHFARSVFGLSCPFETTLPKKVISLTANSDFSYETLIFFSFMRSKICSSTAPCSYIVSVCTMVSSRYTSRVFLQIKSAKVASINRLNHAGDVLIPIGIDRYSSRPNSQMNALN